VLRKKNLDYYLNLDYDLDITRYDDEDEVTYQAASRDLDPLVFNGVGETKEEAIKRFELARIELFEHYFERGIDIPKPTRTDSSLPSGRFVVRTTPLLHSNISKLAAKRGQSLNQYVNTLFQTSFTSEKIIAHAEQRLEGLVCRCEKRLSQMYEFHWGEGARRPKVVKTYALTG
jgi:predicted HicB family RNase H-like nuclease